MEKIDTIIKNTDDRNVNNIDWTNAWSGKYPILTKYQTEVNISYYANELKKLLDSLEIEYGYNKLDSMLVLKDTLYHEWKDNR